MRISDVSYGLIILAGILSGAIFKEPFFGTMFGALVAFIIGIPFSFILCFLLQLLIKNETAEKLARYLTVLSIITLFWLLFQPPGWLRFRAFIANPPPPSVKNIHAKWINGAFDVPSYTKFEISKTDLDKIILNRKYEPLEIDQFLCDHSDLLKNEWFNMPNIESIEVYLIPETDRYTRSHYILYDPVTRQAVHLSWCHQWNVNPK